MNEQYDDQRIQENVAAGFRALLARMAPSSAPQSDIDRHIEVAFAVWQAGNGSLSISMLLDVLIRTREAPGAAGMLDMPT